MERMKTGTERICFNELVNKTKQCSGPFILLKFHLSNRSNIYILWLEIYVFYDIRKNKLHYDT